METKQLELLEELEVAVLVVQESDGRILYANPVVYKNLSREPVQILHRHYHQVFTPEFCTLYESMKVDCQDGKEHSNVFYWKEKRMWEQILSKRVAWGERGFAILLSIMNITEVSHDMMTYQHLAYFDNLLEIPNGAKLEEDINQLENPDRAALVYMEIDHLDNINDLYGFDVGDALLVQVRDWLLESETRDAEVYRVTNGFAILSRNVTMDDGIDRATQICRRFEKPWVVGALGEAPVLYCHVNVGVVFDKYVKNEMRNLLTRTIKAPKNNLGFAVYDEQTDKAVRDHQRLLQTLRNCVLDGMTGFSVHYQPIVEAGTHRWIGAEALCRWTTPEQEEISPVVFIPLAEQMGLIDVIDNWVREVAMTQCMKWRLNRRDFMLDVNFSPRQAINESFLQNLMTSLRKTGYPALKLTMEITESAKMLFTEADMQGLQWLKEQGVMLSLDDFGTGYSSIENLMKVPSTYIKVEKMFLDNIETDGFRQYMLQVVVGIAQHMGMKIVSEGVENKAQCKLVEAFGVDYMQGYLFSRPLSTAQFAKELHRFATRDEQEPPGPRAV